MEEESLVPANKCHHMVASLHMDIMVHEHHKDLLDLTVDIQAHNMEDQIMLLLVLAPIPVTQALLGNNIIALDPKVVPDGLLILVVRLLTQMVA